MSLKEFKKKEEVKDFFEGVTQQMSKQYSKETFDNAVDTMYKLFKRAENMSSEDVDSYLTTCLGVYILDSFENSDYIITDIMPENIPGGGE